MAWLPVIPGRTPACRPSGDTCHSRRISSGASSASGSAASSGRRATSQRSANSGIQQHAAVALVRRGGGGGRGVGDGGRDVIGAVDSDEMGPEYIPKIEEWQELRIFGLSG